MNFWSLTTGEMATGSADSSHIGNFKIIPDGTTAHASIKEFVLDDKENMYILTWLINDGEFKGRNINHKIKCFDSKDSIRDRAVNMMLRIFNICGYKPTSLSPPSNIELSQLRGKVLGIKIGEWSQIKEDGSLAEGNHIQEVHPVDESFIVQTGVKLEATGVPSALTRNSRVVAVPEDSIPF